MQARRGQAEDGVPGSHGRPVDDVGTLDDADAAARQVEGVVGHEVRVFRRLATDQRAARLAAAGRDRADHLGDGLRDDPSDRHVVEERDGLGAAAHDVVGAHRHEVDADGVEPPEGEGELGLGADAVGRGDDQRLAVAGRDRERAAEPAETPDDLGPTGRFDVRPHELDRGLPGRHVDARRAVRLPARLALGAGTRHRPTTASSSMNLRLLASYGTGSG